MSIEIYENDPFCMEAVRWTIEGQIIACPECGNETGLRFTAFAADATSRGECPNRHYWDEARMPGRYLRDAYASSYRLPTRYVEVSWGSRSS